MRFYESRISWLSVDSRRLFGVVKGKRIALVIEDSAQLGVLECGRSLDALRGALGQLLKEQLEEKECVHLIKFGSSASEPVSLPFNTGRTQ